MRLFWIILLCYLPTPVGLANDAYVVITSSDTRLYRSKKAKRPLSSRNRFGYCFEVLSEEKTDFRIKLKGYKKKVYVPKDEPGLLRFSPGLSFFSAEMARSSDIPTLAITTQSPYRLDITQGVPYYDNPHLSGSPSYLPFFEMRYVYSRHNQALLLGNQQYLYPNNSDKVLLGWVAEDDVMLWHNRMALDPTSYRGSPHREELFPGFARLIKNADPLDYYTHPFPLLGFEGSQPVVLATSVKGGSHAWEHADRPKVWLALQVDHAMSAHTQLVATELLDFVRHADPKVVDFGLIFFQEEYGRITYQVKIDHVDQPAMLERYLRNPMFHSHQKMQKIEPGTHMVGLYQHFINDLSWPKHGEKSLILFGTSMDPSQQSLPMGSYYQNIARNLEDAIKDSGIQFHNVVFPGRYGGDALGQRLGTIVAYASEAQVKIHWARGERRWLSSFLNGLQIRPDKRDLIMAIYPLAFSTQSPPDWASEKATPSELIIDRTKLNIECTFASENLRFLMGRNEVESLKIAFQNLDEAIREQDRGYSTFSQHLKSLTKDLFGEELRKGDSLKNMFLKKKRWILFSDFFKMDSAELYQHLADHRSKQRILKSLNYSIAKLDEVLREREVTLAEQNWDSTQQTYTYEYGKEVRYFFDLLSPLSERRKETGPDSSRTHVWLPAIFLP